MTDLTHIHYGIDDRVEPYVGTPVSTLCGIYTPYEDEVTKPVCPDCYTRVDQIKRAEFAINSAVMLQVAAEQRHLMKRGVECDE